jgi:hypothetical protein
VTFSRVVAGGGLPFSRRYWGDFCLSSCCLIFFSPPPASSESYAFGFNNRLCLLLFLGLVTAVAGVTWAGGLEAFGLRKGGEPYKWRTQARGLFLRVFAVAVVLAALFFWLTYSVGGINDSTYFLDRIHLMERGMRPFHDFEFVYGSGPLYGFFVAGASVPCVGERRATI